MTELTDRRPPAVGPLDDGRQARQEPPVEPDEDHVMTFVGHLTELRRRMFLSIFAVAGGAVLGFLLAPTIIALLAEPIPGPIYFTQPGGALILQLKLALLIGVALGAPVLLYHFWAFVAPGLTPSERRVARPWIPIALVLLVVGILLAYLILPFTVTFLIGFQIADQLEPLITADHYFGFVLMMFVLFGLAMQFPIVLAILVKAGILSVDKLRRGRRYALIGLFILAVVVTPQDPFSSLLMTTIMYPIYELTIYLVARGQADRAQPPLSAD